MRLFRSGGSDSEPEPEVPEWAAFFDREALAAFIGLVDDALERGGGGEREYYEDAVDVELAGQPVTLGLSNLAQKCHPEPRAEWAGIVEEHIDGVLEIIREREPEVPLEDALPRLRLQPMWRPEMPDDLEVVGFSFADDVVASLELAFDNGVAGVTPEDVARWGRPEVELLERAAKNTRTADGVEIGEREIEGARCVVALSEGFIAASQALWPDCLVDDLPDEGALVAMPNRHVGLVCPLRGAAVAGAIRALLPWAHDRYLAGPGSISPHLYWWTPDRTLLLPSEVDEGTVRFAPPQEFAELLDRLAADDSR